MQTRLKGAACRVPGAGCRVQGAGCGTQHRAPGRIAHPIVFGLLVIFIFASLYPPITEAQSAPPAEAPVAIDPSAWRIGPEDVLDLAVSNHPELTRTVPVRPDGQISLPLVQDIKAAGLTPMELRDQLTSRLAEYIANPSVSVIVNEIHSFKVSVLGEVKTPGRYELRSRATVLDVLALAEGFTEYASKGRIVILRQDGSNVRRLQFDFGDAVGSRAASANIPVQPGDIVIVP